MDIPLPVATSKLILRPSRMSITFMLAFLFLVRTSMLAFAGREGPAPPIDKLMSIVPVLDSKSPWQTVGVE